ncbi:hypothetical protein OSB04_un001337 [Centaurea solstitialis]|uniref:Uncharacterized protein n=1 Tax=Centaurea solstitialis TaxID=347529 RepID=A0AA38SFR3_9ASTR|nr:hypothetical protein OSB04_un001337 [Centaurea solstitialis]
MVRCKRTDGKRWQCSRPAMEGKAFCEAHYLQIRHRQLKKPVPESIKLQPRFKRSKSIPKPEEEDSYELRSNVSPQQRANNKRKRSGGETSNAVSEVGSSSRTKRAKKGNNNPKETPVVKDLKYGVMEIGGGQGVTPASASKQDVSPKKKVGVPLSTSGFRRPIRSKNAEPVPIATVQMLPSIKANIKATAKKTNNKRKCHWCKWTSYRVFVQCFTCKLFFCEECIDQRFYDKAAVKRECPICDGTCYCKPCIKERLKADKLQELVVNNLEKESVVSDPDEDLAVSDSDEDLAVSVSDSDSDLVVCDPEKDMVVSDPADDLVVSDPADDLVVSDPDDNLVVCDPDVDLFVYNPEKEVVVYNREKRFEKIQQLHMIRQLLPVIEKMNQEKIIAFDSEPKNEGEMLSQLQVQLGEGCSQKHQCRNCSFCDDWIADLHRSCIYCPYTLCMLCCQEFSDGYLHSGLTDLKNTRVVRSKRPRKMISWSFCADGSIICPPKSLGGCGKDFLKLDWFFPFNWTKDLEASAKQIVFKYRFKKPFGISSSPCFLCEENDETGSEKVGNLNKNIGLYFSTKQDFKDKNLEHFMKHWGEGQPVIIRDVFQSQPDLSWDFGFVLCRYLERSPEARNGTGTVKSRSRSDWCEVKFGRRQTFAGGKTYENVWQEFLDVKLWFNSGFFQEHFRDHYDAVMQALPVEEYLNPLTGFLNLAANVQTETRNPNLGPCVHISYGGPEDLMGSGHLTKLCWNPHDMMNILAHATARPISEAKLNHVKILMKKYSSEDHLTSSSIIRNRNKIEEVFGSLSDDSSTDDSDDEDFSEDEIRSRYGEEQVIDTCGAQWDVFRREDVPKLLDYLRKYSDKLAKFYGSPEMVVHPLFDKVYYLDDPDKTRLKEEFGVEPWSFEQHIGEAVIIPAGCPYQMKKIKSCVNVVLEFISPESANECIKVGDELRQLPVNHRAKGKRMEVKKMVIDGMHASIEEMRTVLQTGFVKAEG